jgi:hypothetical protein
MRVCIDIAIVETRRALIFGVENLRHTFVAPHVAFNNTRPHVLRRHVLAASIIYTKIDKLLLVKFCFLYKYPVD